MIRAGLRAAGAAAAAVATVVFLVVVGGAGRAEAHVGNGAIVEEGQAGPYHLVVTIRSPDVIPGIAAVEVLASDDDVTRLSVVPLPLRGEGAASPPLADQARRDVNDPHLYWSTIWLMQAGTWQVRINVEGGRGGGGLAVPVPAIARAVKPMPGWLTGMLVLLLALIVTGAVAIVGASVREADLPPGAPIDRRRRRRGRAAMGVCSVVLGLAIVGGRGWWNQEARAYRRMVYKPLEANASVHDGILGLAVVDPGWLRWRRTDDLVPEHGHLMHLFAIRTPGLDAVAHLHPRLGDAGRFVQSLPPSGSLPAGPYRLFGDIVHVTGLDETVTTNVNLTPDSLASAGSAAMDPDDAWATISHAASAASPSFAFPDGRGALRWEGPASFPAGKTVSLAFALSDPRAGNPVQGPQPGTEPLVEPYIEPYMGMAGHAMIVARDLSIFAHVHPTGSVPMAALALVPGAAPTDHSHHVAMRFSPLVRFPYNFPRAGDYRVFVQIKTGGKIETAAFDVSIGPSSS
jgi:hypothetical protein